MGGMYEVCLWDRWVQVSWYTTKFHKDCFGHSNVGIVGIHTAQHWHSDRLRVLVVRDPGYRSSGPGFDSSPYQIFWEAVGLERGALSLVTINEELLEWKSSGSGVENRDERPWGPVVLTTQHLLPAEDGTNIAGCGGLSVGVVRLLTKSHGVCLKQWPTMKRFSCFGEFCRN
jgi:hypothetical protein